MNVALSLTRPFCELFARMHTAIYNLAGGKKFNDSSVQHIFHLYSDLAVVKHFDW